MITSSIKKLSPHPHLFVYGIILIGIFLRLYHIDRALGGGDENEVLLSWVYTPIDSIVTTWSFTNMGGHHVFHTIVLRMMVLLFGEENELAIRFPAFAAGIACLWFIYKIAKEISPSKTVAQLALLAAVICPIHIYYSQTARGYSFMMFFSTLAIYATLKLIKSDKYFRWGLLLFLSGFLSVYTLPLSVLFILGLALWVLFVLKIPSLKAEFGLNLESSDKKFYQFLSVFLLMGICSFLSYWSLIDRMMGTSTEYYNNSKIYSSSWDMLIYFIPNLFLKILPGSLIYFSPFFVAGIFWGKTCNRAYRLLPVIILLTTYLVTLITGLVWYPRVYLFNLPLFLIFLVSGIFWAGERFRGLIKSKISINWVGYSLMGTYVALALTEIFLNHYPSIKTYNAKEYKHNISSQTQRNDLLLVADSRHYLYARSIYKKNLQNIIADNQLSGIKLLVNNALKIEDYKVNTSKGFMPVFFNWQGKLNSKSVSNDRKLIHLNEIKSTSLLSEDFEATADWKIHSGAGEFSLIKDHKFTGEYSLLTKAFPKQDMVLQSLIGQIELDQPHLIVLTWSTMKFAFNDKYFAPILVIGSNVNGKTEYGQIPLGQPNLGMSLYTKEKAFNDETYYWQVHSAIGWLPAGKISLNLLLNCEAGKSIIYDSLRFFLVKKPSQPEKRTPMNAKS
ncbi:MAG TPA: hypothetical protein EYG21_03470 [Nitrospinaceae bacterium]|nr:hypothetical protein [Nitrospinaceae bacterium]